MADKRTKKLENIQNWSEYYIAKKVKLATPTSSDKDKRKEKENGKINCEKEIGNKLVKAENSSESEPDDFDVNEELNEKVSIWQGDITILEIDAIVNAANRSLAGGGGVDGAIHRAAGRGLYEECKTIGGCQYGDAKITEGYKLPSKHVIHTVGPQSEKPDLLKSCYKKCFDLLLENGLRSIAFPCIATGIYGYPNKNAAHIALKETREFLTKNGDKVDRVIFCIFLEKDLKIYEQLLQYYFPIVPVTPNPVNEEEASAEPSPTPTKPCPSPTKKADEESPGPGLSVTNVVTRAEADGEGPSTVVVNENETSTLDEKDSN